MPRPDSTMSLQRPLFLRPVTSRCTPRLGSTSRARHLLVSRSSLTFVPETAKYYKELEAAVDVVDRACRLCVDVKKTLLSRDNHSLEKNDNTPVTIADFGVQALISLELGRLFPSFPLVAEEDSSFLRSNSEEGSLVWSVVSAVKENMGHAGYTSLTPDDVLEAIDRGVKDELIDDEKHAMYWVLDPIDGTRGFLRGDDAFYVVGLALVTQGNIVIGVMGCPNWKHDSNDFNGREMSDTVGMIMVSHVGCGTWERNFSHTLVDAAIIQYDWRKCYVDQCYLIQNACFCIPDSQTWESLPLSATFGSSTDVKHCKNAKEVLLRPTCCGSLCKYMMVASGRASVFILRAKPDTLIKVWDHAVGVLCVIEAGGQVTDWGGYQLDCAGDKVQKRIIFPSGGVLVTNGSLHSQMLELISATD